MKDNTNLQLIKDRLNILDVVSTYIKLEKSGNQYKARCPFHNEKSPSFYVSPSRGSYHCFGCSEHGDIFSFTMKIEGINFKDALRLLADKAGVSLANFKKEETSNLIDILENATLFFENCLSKSEEAKQYLKGRGIAEETVKNFRIGFAPNDWRQLYTKLNQAGYSDEEIVSSGICIKHEKGLYDRFRSRIIFPICNASGKVVAYTGRIIGADEGKDGVAKYVNSPETAMYHKSSILFGYDKAKQEISKQKKIIVVEGQMDVVMSHQSGILNTVAISGTAFTGEHISIIKRFAETVVLALDSDKAGYNAMLKSAMLALQNDIEVEGIKLTDKDPADMIKHNKDSWALAVKNAGPILTLIASIIIDKEKIKPRQIQMLRKDLFPLLRAIKSPLLRESYSKEIAELLNINIDIIKQETDNVASELQLQVKQEKKKLPQVELLKVLAEVVCSISFLTNQNLKDFYNKKLGEYLLLQSELSIEAIPEEILNMETFALEKQIGEREDFQVEEHTKQILEIFLRKLMEKLVESYKSKIREGIDVEDNLRHTQNITKKINSLRTDLNYV